MNIEENSETIVKTEKSQEEANNLSRSISVQNHSTLPKFMFLMLMIMIFSFRFSDDLGLINLLEKNEKSSNPPSKDSKDDGVNLKNLANLIHYIPNITIPIFAGFLVDYLGVMDMINYSQFTMLLGNIICFLWARDKVDLGYNGNGLIYKQLEYFMCGRIIFGLGSESLWVCSMVLLCYWFRKYKFGVQMNLVFTAFYLENVVYDTVYLIYRSFGYFHQNSSNMDYSLQYNLGTALFFCLLSLIAGCFISNFEKKRQRWGEAIPIKDRYNPTNQKSFWQSFKKILLFRPLMIIVGGALVMSTLTVSIAYLGLYTRVCFQGDFKGNKSDISRGMSLLFNVVALGTSFFVGRQIDSKGHRAILFIFGSFFITMGFVLKYIIIHNNQAERSLKMSLFISSLATMGFGASFFYGNVYSCAPVLVKERYYGIFYGTMTALKNIINFVLTASFEVSEGAIENLASQYMNFIIVGISINCIVFVIFLIVQIYDKNQKNQVLSRLPRHPRSLSR